MFVKKLHFEDTMSFSKTISFWLLCLSLSWVSHLHAEVIEDLSASEKTQMINICKQSQASSEVKSEDSAKNLAEEKLVIEEEYLQYGRSELWWKKAKSYGLASGYYMTMSLLNFALYYKFPALAQNTMDQIRRLASPANAAVVGAAGAGATSIYSPVMTAALGVANLYFNQHTISNFISSDTRLYKWTQSILKTPLDSGLNIYENFYAVKRKFEVEQSELPQAHKRAIVDILTQVETSLDPNEFHVSFSMGGDGKNATVFKDLQKVLAILAIPRKEKKLTLDEQTTESLNSVLENYPTEVKDTLRNLTRAKVSYTRDRIELRSHLFLLGAPGTGKTRLVKKYADAMGLPLIKISFAKIKEVSDLVGSSNMFERKGLSAFSKAFLLVETDKRFSNGIIFIDEIDKSSDSHRSGSIKEFLLQLLDKDNKTLKLEDLGVTIDLSKYTIVFAGNKSFAESSLMSRVKTINFGGFTLEKRVGIACSYFHGIQSKNPLSAEEIETLVSIAHVDQAHNIGVRALFNVVDEFFQFKTEKILFGEKGDFDVKASVEKASRNIWDPVTAIESMRIKFNTLKAKMSEQAKEKVKKLFNNADASIHESDKDYRILKINLVKIQRILDMPHSLVDLSQNSDIKNKLDELLSMYPEDISSAVRDSVWSHMANSADLDTDVRKNILFFYGKQGTGKTHLAQNISKILGLPLIELNFHGSKHENLVSDSTSSSDHPSADLAKLSALSSAFITKSGKTLPLNGVIFIDEAHRILNSKVESATYLKAFLHDFLDPEKPSYTLHDVGVDIDLSRYLFILASNERINAEPKEGEVAAFSSLESRLKMLYFEGYSEESKTKIARSYATRLFSNKKFNIDEDSINTLIDDYVRGNSDMRVILTKLAEKISLMKFGSKKYCSADEGIGSECSIP